MATTPTYTADFMKRIAFLDGQVLHDFHLNIMQKNIAEAIKLKTTRERYDFYLLVSPYRMVFMEPFVNTTDRSPNSTATLNQTSYSISDGSWESTLLELPALTDEFYILSSFEDFPNNGAHVNFYYRNAEGSQWIPVDVNTPTYLPVPRQYFQIKVECLYTGTVRPTVYDYALMWK